MKEVAMLNNEEVVNIQRLVAGIAHFTKINQKVLTEMNAICHPLLRYQLNLIIAAHNIQVIQINEMADIVNHINESLPETEKIVFAEVSKRLQ